MRTARHDSPKQRSAGIGAALVLAVMLSLSAAVPVPQASAQWLDYPTPGVPRTSDGAPDLDAPAPTTRAGTPDLSGIWRSTDTLEECEDCIQQMPLPVAARDIGHSLPDGLPYTPWSIEAMEQRNARNDPHAHCLPPNFPRGFSFPQFKKIVQTPDVVVILHEFNASYRQIFTDGRPLLENPSPTWNGYSTGRWEGDTLVVESNGFRDDLWLDLRGSPLTSAAHVTERFRRIDYGSLEIEITVDDPEAYTEPWTVTLRQSIVPDTQILDEVCLENNKFLEP